MNLRRTGNRTLDPGLVDNSLAAFQVVISFNVNQNECNEVVQSHFAQLCWNFFFKEMFL